MDITKKESTTTSEAAAQIAKMDITAFMPNAAKSRVDEVVTVKAPPSFKNADGTRASMKIRKLPYEEIQEIVQQYQTRRIVRDRRGRPETTGAGRAAVIEDSNSTQMACAMIAKALVFPDLNDQELAKAYNVIEPQQLVLKIFNTSEDFTYVIQAVNDVNGLTRDADDSYEEQLKEHAKN